MKVWSWLALVLIFAALAYAEAAPSVLNGGPVSGFLTVENSPYTVNETIEVPEGKALVIEAGVTLKFKSGAGLDVSGGSFMVMGTEDRPVVFEGEDGSWNGISLTGNHRAELSYLEIDGAEIGLAVERGSLSLNGVYIRNVSRMALFAKEAEVKAAIDAVQQLSVDVGIPTKLEKLKEEDLPFLCESAAADACAPGNPREASLADYEAMFRKLM